MEASLEYGIRKAMSMMIFKRVGMEANPIIDANSEKDPLPPECSATR